MEPASAAEFDVRPPWPDEMERVRQYLPGAFLHGDRPRLGVAVAGRAGRLVGVCALSMERLRAYRAGWLGLRTEGGVERLAVMEALLRPALAAAWAAGAEAVVFSQTIGADTPDAELLRRVGFEAQETHEVYETALPALWTRIDRIHRRLRERGLIPAGAQVTPLLPTMAGAARRFLAAHMPQGLSTLALGVSGQEARDSRVLWVDGAFKGLLLCQRVSETTHHTTLRLVAPELRGGLAWANLLLLHTAMKMGMEAALKWSRFEVNPALHEDTRQLALSLDASLVAHLIFFRIARPEIN